MTLDQIIRINSDVKILSKEAGSYAYLILPDNSIKVINNTAHEILRLCNGRRTIKEIAKDIASKFGLDPGLILNDVVEFLIKARSLGAVEFI